ncbi:ribosome maturation factor RimM [Acuticoccus sp. MNP-M23]|uniref:ribosome maturation factor RimM n=1 Tax=Acuticoccus sp. MNP-M23 TaxID=3072793 RepID=UPI002815C75B|nr:ribosome maturation factor RimM [Acuticoccus sp. MNP-M23]WMS41114.1 ribosome maturation factor RimM [Acuticoccus sp. MNP-M23]
MAGDPRGTAGEPTVVMATIGAAHGVRGAVKLTVHAEDPATLKRYNPFQTADGRTFKVKSVKPIGKALVAELEGVPDRNAAELLRGTDLLVPRRRLPRPDEEEFYHIDLIGLQARLVSGEILGVVRAVNDFGAGDILEIVGPRTVMVPFTQVCVPAVDLEAGTLTVDPIPGLLDEPGEPPADAEISDTNDGGA